jgi:hypothetical protein
MMYMQNASDMASQGAEMLEHLEREGTPIMMGTSVDLRDRCCLNGIFYGKHTHIMYMIM